MSPRVYDTQRQEEQNELQRQERRKELLAGVILNAIQNGAVDPQKGQEMLGQVAPDLAGLPIGPDARTQKLTREQQLLEARQGARDESFQPADPMGTLSITPVDQRAGLSPERAAVGMDQGIQRQGAGSIMHYTPTPEEQTGLQPTARQGLSMPALDVTSTGPAVTAPPADPELNPDNWRAYAAKLSSLGDREGANDALKRANDLEAQMAPKYEVKDGQLIVTTPRIEAGSVIGYESRAVPVEGFDPGAGGTGARAMQAAMIRDLMLREGASPTDAQNTADKIASGSWTKETDPQSGVTRIIDLSSPGGPRLVREFRTEVSTPPSTSTATPADIQPGQAVGAGGVFKNLGNAVADFIGVDIPFPQTEAASNALQNLRINTLSVMQAAGSWRPSVFTSNLLDQVAQKPLQFFRGEARSRDRMESTRRMIQQEVENIDKALKSGNLRPNAISDYTQKRIQLQQLEREYKTVVDAFDRAKKGVDIDIEDFWE